MPQSPLLSVETAGGNIRLSATGPWAVETAGQLESEIEQFLARSTDGKSEIVINAAGITRLDTFGAWLLERLRRDVVARGGKVSISGLDKRNLPLLEQMETVNRKPQKPAAQHGFLATIADHIADFFRDLGGFLAVLGAFFSGLVKLVTRPGQFRLTSTVFQFDRVGFQALGIVILVTFIIGAILAQQGFFHFRSFGADLYVIDMVGFLVMRELGVLLVAIMVAGRSGSSYTAELGSMRMQEEIDALRTMGFNPVEILIVPRILVLIIAMPVLTFIGSLAALFGAGIVAVYYAGLSPQLFMDRLNEAITMTHFKVGMIKAPFIGAVIGVIACTEGLRVQGSATSLGTHTTRAVVKSIFMVIVLDGIFAIFFSTIGI